MKRTIAFLLTVSIVFTSSFTVFATGSAKQPLGLNELEAIISEAEIMSGPPAGVVFGEEHHVAGNYAFQGTVVSIIVGMIAVALGLSEIGGVIATVVTAALSLGISQIYWDKYIAYGEDDEYYYVRTRVRFYSDAGHEHPLSDWEIVYSRRSKNAGAGVELEG